MFPSTPWIGLLGWYHLLAFGVLVPVLAYRTAARIRAAERPLPSRLAHFRSTALMLVLFTGFSLIVARKQWIDLFPRGETRWGAGAAAGIVMYAAAVAFMRPRWRRAVEKRTRIVYLFMPDNAVERAWWVGVAVLAGIGEEITWRGVQTALLVALTGNYAAAVILSAVSFGLGHMMQGWGSVAIIGVFALGFSTIVWLSGSLYVAMAVHVAYDVTAGLTYGRLGRELGYELPEPSRAPAPVPGA